MNEKIPVKIHSRKLLVDKNIAKELSDELDATLCAATLMSYNTTEFVKIFNVKLRLWRIVFLFENSLDDYKFVTLQFIYKENKELIEIQTWSHTHESDAYSYHKGETYISVIRKARLLLE